ncbi:MarR family transcriptional regulator [Oleomonas cavernae]|uniref:MarR family transcriptional regulator n=1 Tax=Oleomonas cavernae TaxID=2320859 RepID=A0A418WH93_9PROT|nr:MarR family transcriptional regulator [Oleomonas cavernae]RJF89414.1 MarR family transcriptional regulator [Oleomonas cavernae]
MRGIDRLQSVERSTPLMREALPDLPMTQTVMVRLMRISVFGMSDYFEPVFRKLGLSENMFHVLCLLLASESGEASPSELSDLVGTSRGNMTRILDALVAEGLIVRAVAERDARRYSVAITPAGRDAAERAVPRLAGPLERAFSGLSPEELGTLDRLLRKAVVSFDKSARPFKSVA